MESSSVTLCTVTVGSDQWGCEPHWRSLPNDIRAWIGRSYRIGSIHDTHPTESWRDAHRAALDWIREHTQEPRE